MIRDSQRVPSSPFLERFTPPSLYSMNEAPLTFVPWMKRSSTNFAAGTQNYENRGNQRHVMVNKQHSPNI